MKKLLFVLLIAALASYLFVGCMPVTPGEGEGEGEGEAEICPTVAVTSQVAVGGKNYIKGGAQTITVTFAVPTEPVSVWVPTTCIEKGAPEGVPDSAVEVVMYPDADKKVYTGEIDVKGDCCEFYIYVLTCDACAPCKTPFIVDDDGPDSKITITTSECVCEGCNLIFKTPTQSPVCGVTDVCCGDYCSGFGSYSIDLYLEDPFDVCCDVPCVTPAYSCTGVACPVDCTFACIPADTYYVVVTLLDAVGNRTRYYAKVVLDALDADCTFTVTEYKENKLENECTDWEVVLDTDTTIGLCLGDVG